MGAGGENGRPEGGVTRLHAHAILPSTLVDGFIIDAVPGFDYCEGPLGS